MPAFWYMALIAWATTLAALPLCMRLARRLGMVDKPAHRKIHQAPVPFLGGAAIFIGFAAAMAVLLLCFSDKLSAPEQSKLLMLSGLGVLGLLVGLLDDRYQVRPRHKLIMQVLVLGMFACAAYRLTLLRIPGFEPWSLSIFSLPMTLFWMLAIVNGANLIDGIDGLAGTVIFTTMAMTGIVAWQIHDHATMYVCLAACGSVLAFLMMNWKPARIFLGDAGTIGLGMLMAGTLVGLGSKESPRFFSDANTATVEVFQFHIPGITLLAVYPALEVTLSVVRRLLRGKSIGSADRAHIHHKLLNAGWGPPRICLTAAVLAMLGGFVVLASLGESRGAAAWVLLATGLFIGILMHYCGYLQTINPESIRDIRPHFLVANYFYNMQKTKLELSASVSEVICLIQQSCTEFNVESLKLTLDGTARKGEDLRHDWTHAQSEEAAKPSEAASMKKDRIHANEGKSHAEWQFLPRASEEDIDVEHRVLMHEFMVRALARADVLFAASGVYDRVADKIPDGAVLSSGALRSRARQDASDSSASSTPVTGSAQ